MFEMKYPVLDGEKPAEEGAPAGEGPSPEETAAARGDHVEDVKPAEDAKPAEDVKPAGETTSEAEAESEPTPRGHVPYHRFKTKVTQVRERDAQLKEREETIAERDARIAELEAKLNSGTPASGAKDTSLEDREAEINARIDKALEDEDMKAYHAATRDQRALDQERHEAQLAQAQSQAVNQATDEAAYSETVEDLLMAYPQLDSDLEDVFDEALSDAVVTMAEGMRVRNPRMTRSAALIEAVARLIPDDGAPDTKNGESKGDEVRQARAEEATRRGVEDAGKQPPETDGGRPSDRAGLSDNVKDVQKLTDAEWDALPESTRKRYRGDELGVEMEGISR